MSKQIRWSSEKAKQLSEDQSRGGVNFEDCVIAIGDDGILDIIENPSSNHVGQTIYVLNIEGYAYSVPFVETGDEIFLKTLFPNRKLTALYIGKRTP